MKEGKIQTYMQRSNIGIEGQWLADSAVNLKHEKHDNRICNVPGEFWRWS